MPSKILLINVSGLDEPGLMATVTTKLAEHGAYILDVGQSVIHDELNLGILVQLFDTNINGSQTEALGSLRNFIEGLGMSMRITAVSGKQYSDWVSAQGKLRYILTLLASGNTSEQLAAVTSIVRQHDLNIDGLRRLSGRIPPGQEKTGTIIIEMSLRGRIEDFDFLKTDLMVAAETLSFDFSVQRDNVFRRTRRLVAFDMDSTLINVEVIDELAERHGVGAQVEAITQLAMQGELDFDDSFRARAKLLKGLSKEVVHDVAANVKLNSGADRLLKALRYFGFKTAIISGGFQYVGDLLKDRLGIDYVFGNSLELENGVMTGEVVGKIINAQRKSDLLLEIAKSEDISAQQTIAIGDGANDVPMLNAAGLGVAYHAKPVVRSKANHVISEFGLDSVLYLMGFSDLDVEEALSE